MSKRFLVAIELAPPAAEDVLGKATALVAPSDTVDVLYVVDPTTVIYAADPTLTGKMYTEMYERAMANARRRLGEICEPFRCPRSGVTCAMGAWLRKCMILSESTISTR